MTFIVLATAIAAFSASFLFHPIYQAQATLIPTETPGGLGSLQSIGEIGGLASLAGINFGANNTKTTEAIAVLGSRQFTMSFIRDENLIPVLFSHYWDPNRGTWRVSGKNIPTDDDAFDYFDKKIRFISEDKTTGIVTLSIDWRNRFAAARWTAELVKRLNAQMRARAIAESNASIAQLETQLTSTSVVPLQRALAQLLEAQIERRTFALVRPDFAFRVIDPPVVPDKKERIFPKRILFLTLGSLAGLILTIITAFAIVKRSRL